ncbi:MAG: PQQ-binding-like beta-propeller repeat protein [Candidatus Eremiobacterota bacterium]
MLFGQDRDGLDCHTHVLDLAETGPPPGLAAGPTDEVLLRAGRSIYRVDPRGVKKELVQEKDWVMELTVGQDGMIYCQTYAGHVVAASPEGQEVWRAYGADTQYPTLAMAADGDTVCSARSEYVVGLDARTGREKWHYHTERWAKPLGVGPGDLLYVGHENSLEAVQPSRWLRKSRWSVEDARDGKHLAWMSPLGELCYANQSGQFVGLDAQGGVRWKVSAQPEKVRFASDGSLVYLEGRTLHWLDPEGKPLREEVCPGRVTDVTLGADGNTYARLEDPLGAQSLRLAVFRPDGTRRIVHDPMPDATGSLQVTAGSVVYASTTRGNFLVPLIGPDHNQVYACQVSDPARFAAEEAEELKETLSPTVAPIRSVGGWLVVGGVRTRMKRGHSGLRPDQTATKPASAPSLWEPPPVPGPREVSCAVR